MLPVAWAFYLQLSSASLTGIVTDPSQARLANVTLHLVSEETGVSNTATTNEQGEYTFPLVNPGRFRLTTEHAGFQSTTRSGIVLELGRVSRLDLALQLGQVSETINVAGTTPLLESETATLGQFIENKTVTDMPLNGRRVGQLMALMGHAVFITGDVIRPRYTIAGSRSDSQQWLLDGVNASNIALEVPQALFNPPVEAVQEVRVQQNAYSAEFGNSAGGIIQMTTRSGTNDFKGTIYEYFRNDKLDARPFFAAAKPPLRWNVFGPAIGGPILKNKTFFFSHMEIQRQRVGQVRIFTVPSDLERTGNFSRTLTAAGAVIPVFDPNSSRPSGSQTIRDQFPGNVIPASRIDPVAAKLVPLFPAANRAAQNLAGANNFGGSAVDALNLNTWTSKIDHNFSDKDRLWIRYVRHAFPSYTTSAFAESAADPNATISDRTAHSFVVSEQHSFGPRSINDFRFNWQQRFFHNYGPGLGQGWPGKLGLKGVKDRAFPRVTVAGYATMGPATQERTQMPIHDTDLVDSLMLFRGSHSIKIGGELRLARNVDDLDSQISGSLGFAVQPTAQPGVNNTGNALASTFVGFPNSGSILDTDLLDRRAKYFALFIQDDWKVTSNLTINLGIRWDAHTPRFDANDRQNGFDFAKINPVSGTPGVVTFAGKDGLGHNVYNGDWNNFMPRIGIAWKPFGRQRTVIRSGAGIFFGQPLPGSNNTSAGFETSGSFTTPDNGITAPFLLRNGFPDASRASLDAGFGAVRVGQAIRFAPQFIEVNRRLGYSEQWNFAIQHELGWLTVLELSYIGTMGRKLPGPSASINQLRPDQLGPGNAQIRRPFPQFGDITSQSPFWGNSSYHGFNAKVEKRFSSGLNFLLNYTISKFIDDVTSGQEIGTVGGGIQNIYDRRAERSLSGNDVRNKLVASTVYELPLGRGRHWLNQGPAATIVGGWNLGAILYFQDGSPDGLVTQTNTAGAFGGSQRVNVLRDPSLPKDQRRIERYFDTTAVAAPPQFTFGNSGRAVLTGPGIANADFSLLKNHRIRERFNVQFRIEAFNAFNRVNLMNPGRALGSPQFGVISDTRNPRNLQLGMKLTF